MATPKVLKVAVCLCKGCTFSDFITPMEIISALNMADDATFAPLLGDVPCRVQVDFLAPTKDPVSGATPVPTVNPTKTYTEAIDTQYDIIFVPAGPVPDATKSPITFAPPEQIEFIQKQAPGAQYLLSVCGGSTILAVAGVLKGKKATTNKCFYNQYMKLLKAAKPEAEIQVTWVPKARWVVDGNAWTSSGVTAGNDMALAFVEHLVGPKLATIVRGLIEVVQRAEHDDPFAEVFQLV